MDRCTLEDREKEISDLHREELARLQVEFQLERSTLRKKHREVGTVFIPSRAPSHAAVVCELLDLISSWYAFSTM